MKQTEQQTAGASYETLSTLINELPMNEAIVQINSSKTKIKVPVQALKLLSEALHGIAQGKRFKLVSISNELSTQEAAQILGCSRPHLVKLLEEGKLHFTKVGKHRRVQYNDLLRYQRTMKKEQKRNLLKLMHADEEDNLYDS
jgi:excisionase family DNA binding protein